MQAKFTSSFDASRFVVSQMVAFIEIALLLAVILLLPCSSALASTVAYWRFEGGSADVQVPHGGMADGVFYPGVFDSSWNGNSLSVWAEGWAGYAYRTDVSESWVVGTGEANYFSVQNTGSYPAMFTGSEWMRTLTPAAFTIEASFKPEWGGWRTIVGRDSRGTCSWNTNMAALYLQITPEDAVAIKFCDVSGYWHEAVSPSGLITGFTWPDSVSGRWYNLAAVSDGQTLSLYLDSGFGHLLVAQTDLTLSGSPNTALTAGLGSGADWTAGTWTVGRGLYAGGHTDRAFGFIDEVRISDHPLYWDYEFLFARFGHPQSQTNIVGATVTFSVTAGNYSSLTYQWQTNSVDIPGATNSSYAAANVQLTDSGTSFRAIVSNTSGSVTSAPAILTVRTPVTRTVTTANDDGPGSLRQTVAEALIGDTITFSNSLSGATILLTNGQVLLDQNLQIDASALAKGITIDGRANGRIFEVPSGRTVVLDSLTITNGKVISAGGAGIFNRANLTVNRCTLTGNSAGWGGGLLNYYDDYYDPATMTLNQCTLVGNSAFSDCGGIDNYGTLVLNQSTVTSNTAGSSAGGIGSRGAVATLQICNSIVAGNSAPSSPNISGPVSLTGNNLTSGAPLLAPLGNYGGPTPTMPPLPGSPAIDGCTNGTSFITDQRGAGFARVMGAFADIGAVESGNAIPSLMVTTAADENDGLGANGISLRDAIAYAPAGSTIVFAPALSGSTILLTNGQLNISNSVTILGPGPGALTVSGNNASRVFNVPGTNVTIGGLTIANGHGALNGAGLYAGGGPGSVLKLNNCAVVNNTTTLLGAGLYNSPGVTLTLSNCTVSGNSAPGGNAGGIYNDNATLTVIACTLSRNTAFQVGGGIMNDGSAGGATLKICGSTISSNSAWSGGGLCNYGGSAAATIMASTLNANSAGFAGGNIQNAANATVEIGDSILNAAASGGNIYRGSGAVISRGYNLSSDNGSGFLTGTNDQIDIDPLLGPLQDNGGPTFTHALLLGSPALDRGKRDAITNLMSIADQRGFARLVDFGGVPNAIGGDGSDIGAFEYQGTGGYDTDANGLADAWELAYFPNLSQSGTNDFDGDGHNNNQELLADTCPVDANDCLRIAGFVRSGTSNTLWWTSKPTRLYQIERSATLALPSSWETFMTNSASGWSNAGFENTGSQYFYRVRAVVP